MGIEVTERSVTDSSSDSSGSMRCENCTVNGVNVSLLSVTKSDPWLLGRADSLKEHQRFLLRGRDVRGQSLSTDRITHVGRDRIVSLKLPEGAQRIQLEFIMHDTWKAEFLVRPPQQ